MDCRGQCKKVKKAEREDTDYKKVHVKLRKGKRKNNPWQEKLGKNRTLWKVQESNEKRERTGEDRTQQ